MSNPDKIDKQLIRKILDLCMESKFDEVDKLITNKQPNNCIDEISKSLENLEIKSDKISRDKLMSLTVVKLKKMCRDKNIKKISRLRKSELVDIIYEKINTY
jgi:hypothetical protein